GTSLLQLHGGMKNIGEQSLRRCFRFGTARTFDQDPKYAIRLLVDIAIRALSPAINDPTTAVQALDQIEDLLLRLGNKRLAVDALRDSNGILRVVLQTPAWEDFLSLALDEIRLCGAQSVQVMRRMNALMADLMAGLPAERLRALAHF